MYENNIMEEMSMKLTTVQRTVPMEVIYLNWREYNKFIFARTSVLSYIVFSSWNSVRNLSLQMEVSLF